MPALLINASGRISEANPAAENFLNLSERNLVGQLLLERLSIDAPMEDALSRVRQHQSPLVIAQADVTTGERPPQQCALHFAPLQDSTDIVILIAPRDIADRLQALAWWDWPHEEIRAALPDFRALSAEAFLERYERVSVIQPLQSAG